jgi:hypothetical protein
MHDTPNKPLINRKFTGWRLQHTPENPLKKRILDEFRRHYSEAKLIDAVEIKRQGCAMLAVTNNVLTFTTDFDSNGMDQYRLILLELCDAPFEPAAQPLTVRLEGSARVESTPTTPVEVGGFRRGHGGVNPPHQLEMWRLRNGATAQGELVSKQVRGKHEVVQIDVELTQIALLSHEIIEGGLEFAVSVFHAD